MVAVPPLDVRLCERLVACILAGDRRALERLVEYLWPIWLEMVRTSRHLSGLRRSEDDVRDVAAVMVADPFMIRAGARWHMFFEVLNRRGLKGQIGLASSDDGRRWRYDRIVLDEPFHLEFPRAEVYLRLLAEVEHRPILHLVLADGELRHAVTVERSPALRRLTVELDVDIALVEGNLALNVLLAAFEQAGVSTVTHYSYFSPEAL